MWISATANDKMSKFESQSFSNKNGALKKNQNKTFIYLFVYISDEGHHPHPKTAAPINDLYSNLNSLEVRWFHIQFSYRMAGNVSPQDATYKVRSNISLRLSFSKLSHLLHVV